MKTVLITGASGDVGSHLRRELAGRYTLRLSDLRPLEKKAKGEKFMKADISRMADALRITKGVDAIVHLGGYSVEGPWEGILQANIIGCYNVFEAARRNGVKRILFATSNHAVGFLSPHAEDRPPRLHQARRALRRVESLRRGAGQPVCRQVRHGSLPHAHRQRERRSRSTSGACRSCSRRATSRSW